LAQQLQPGILKQPMKANAPWIYEQTGLQEDPLLSETLAAFGTVVERWIEPLQKVCGMSLDVVLHVGLNDPPAHERQSRCGIKKALKADDANCEQTHRQLRSRALLSLQPERTVCPNGCTLFAVPLVTASKVLGLIEGRRECKEVANIGAPAVPTHEVTAVIELLRSVSASICREAEEPVVTPVLDGNNTDPPAVVRAKALVEKRYAAKLGIAMLAREVCLSEDHFSRLFKRVTGLAFTEYVSRVRVNHAQRILAATTKQIAEVAFECGFESIPHFNRMFKRYAGLPPTAYRASRRASF
jgi:AraC-like DNA-binding protein